MRWYEFTLPAEQVRQSAVDENGDPYHPFAVVRLDRMQAATVMTGVMRLWWPMLWRLWTREKRT